MLTVKTMQVNDTITINIPKQLEVAPNQEYTVTKTDRGTLIFVPKVDPFQGLEENALYVPSEFEEVSLEGVELD